METIILIAVISILNIVCFFVGAKIGQKTSMGEEIKLPDPIKTINEYKEVREYKEEQEKFNTMMDNINNYDGTGMYQKDI